MGTSDSARRADPTGRLAVQARMRTVASRWGHASVYEWLLVWRNRPAVVFSPSTERKPTLMKAPYSRLASLIAAEALEDRIAPATLVGLTAKDALITFDSADPTKILSAVKVTGLA